MRDPLTRAGDPPQDTATGGAETLLRILLLTHSFNSLAQRLFVELRGRGHEVSVELDIADATTLEAVRLFEPDLVVAPFLKRAIPRALWSTRVCLVVHPGIVGDRGPSSLDWAILEGERDWGVTVLRADAEMDAGEVYAHRAFAMRETTKSSLYRNEVTEAACEALLEAVAKHAAEHTRGQESPGAKRPRAARTGDTSTSGGGPAALPAAPDCISSATAPPRGRWRPAMRQQARRIDWLHDPTAAVLAKIRSADGAPGVADEIAGIECRLFDAHPERRLRGAPGSLLATRHGALCRATVDGAVWIGHIRRPQPGFKLPATLALAVPPGAALDPPRELSLPILPVRDSHTWQDIAYEQEGDVGYLHFAFYNGAMSTGQCRRLREAFREAAARPTAVIVLCGGPDFWSNGIHLGTIEAAASPADESMANIEAMDDLCLEILRCTHQRVVAALQGNAGAGGVFLALAADRVWCRSGVVLNPHYRAMGNLYGSEYWTYLLPKRVGEDRARTIMRGRLPMGAPEAVEIGLIDECFGRDVAGFMLGVRARAAALSNAPELGWALERKRAARAADEAVKPLAAWRAEELQHMRLAFYGFDPSYHVARYHFVHRLPHAWTPLHLARHRRRMWHRQALLDNRTPLP